MTSARHLFTVLGATALLAGAAAFQAYGQNGTPSPSPSPTDTPTATATPTESPGVALTLNDVHVVNFIHHINQQEIEELQAAQAALQAPNTTALTTMLNDHQQNDQRLNELALGKGIPVFAFQPSTYDVATTSFLNTLFGTPEYDRNFNESQRDEHQSALTHLQADLGKITDQDVRTHVTQTIEMLQRHLGLIGQPGATPTPTESPTPTGTQSPATAPDSGVEE